MTVRQVLTKDGRVTIATGHNADYVELATPTKIHGLVGALFAKLWEDDDMKRLFEKDYKSLDLVAPTVLSVYNHTSKSAGLYSRMIRCKYPDLRVRIVHDAELLLKATSFSGRHNWPNSIAGLQRRPTSTKATRTPPKRTSTPRRRRRGDGKSVARMAAAESMPWHSLCMAHQSSLGGISLFSPSSGFHFFPATARLLTAVVFHVSSPVSAFVQGEMLRDQ